MKSSELNREGNCSRIKAENIPAEYQGIVEAALAEYESGEPAQYDKSQAVYYAKYMLDLIF